MLSRYTCRVYNYVYTVMVLTPCPLNNLPLPRIVKLQLNVGTIEPNKVGNAWVIYYLTRNYKYRKI